MNPVTDPQDLYVAAHARFARESRTGPAGWVAPLRDAAIARFSHAGFPTSREEAWRKTSVAPIAAIPFRVAAAAPAGRSGVDPSIIEERAFAPVGAPRLVFLDGRFSAALSSPIPRGVAILRLAEDRAAIEPHLGRIARSSANPFVDLNTAFLADGAFVHVQPGSDIAEPIFLVFLSGLPEPPAASFPRCLVLCAERSRSAFVESHASLSGGVALTAAVTEILLEPGAALDYTRIQGENPEAFHISSVQAVLGRESAFTSHAFSIGGAIVRNDLRVSLDAEGASCTLDGLFLVDGSRHADNHTLIDHARPHGTSRELYKGILDGKSRGVFDGSVVVRPNASKTDSFQSNPNLLISDDALMDTKPELQIFNNDVKCRHAATIGRLDEASIFYLRSRGLALDQARSALIQAFAGQIVGRVRDGGLRQRLDEAVWALLAGGARAGAGVPA